MAQNFLLAWHQPERFTLHAVCLDCRHEHEIYIPRLMQQYRLGEYEPVEKVMQRLTCSVCGRKSQTCSADVSMEYEGQIHVRT